MAKQIIPETPPDYDRTRIVERPDGFYWREKGGKREYGPFDTLLQATGRNAREVRGQAGESERAAPAGLWFLLGRYHSKSRVNHN